MLTLNINGKDVEIKVDTDTPLLWAIREEVGLTGTKFGCGIGQCGACTVLVNGKPLRSCSAPATAMSGTQIETIESLAADGHFNTIQQAWLELDVPQCGYCQSGQIMVATAIVQQALAGRRPSPEKIKQQMNNICRCGTYNRIRPAMERALDLAYDANKEA